MCVQSEIVSLKNVWNIHPLHTFQMAWFYPQVNALDGLGQTALHRVAQQGNMQACRLLMSYGVDSSIVSLQGYTAAQLATENIQKMLKGNIQSSLETYRTYK